MIFLKPKIRNCQQGIIKPWNFKVHLNWINKIRYYEIKNNQKQTRILLHSADIFYQTTAKITVLP